MVRGRPRSQNRREIVSASLTPEYYKLIRALRLSPTDLIKEAIDARIYNMGHSGKPMRAILECVVESKEKEVEILLAEIKSGREYLSEQSKPRRMVKAYNPETERFEVVSEEEVKEYHENITPIFEKVIS